MGLGVRLGFAKLIAELRSVRLILEPFDSSKGSFVTVFITEDCWLVSEGHEGAFKDAVGNRGACHGFFVRGENVGCKGIVRLFCVGVARCSVRGSCVGRKKIVETLF